MDDYRVNLDVYNGPLDLLLYLIRRDEVDIHDIPIVRIAEQYIEYVNVLQQLDPNLAGEFLVMVATLIEIKTRMLLPARSAEEADAEEGDALDPRAELVRQLLEYKAFKDAAGDLRELADQQSLRFARRPVRPEFDDEDRELEDVQVWDLFDAFSRLLEQIGRQPAQHEVIYDDTPVELHAADIVDRLQRDGAMSFRDLFKGRTNRGEIIGLFLALLELTRQKRLLVNQDANFGDVWLHLRPESADEPPEELADQAPDEGVYQAEPRPAEPVETSPADGDAPPSAPANPPGQYVSESAPTDALAPADQEIADGRQRES